MWKFLRKFIKIDLQGSASDLQTYRLLRMNQKISFKPNKKI